MTPADFLFRSDFNANLTDEQIQKAIDVCVVMFDGVYTLFFGRNKKKSEMLLNLLIAWWLMDNYPELAPVGKYGNGGALINNKSIGGVSVGYGSYVDDGSALSLLQSNFYGLRALLLFKGAPELAGVYRR